MLPHPKAHERAFVLAPWHDVEPDAEHPRPRPGRRAAREGRRRGCHRARRPLARPAVSRDPDPDREDDDRYDHERPSAGHVGTTRPGTARRARPRRPGARLGCCGRSRSACSGAAPTVGWLQVLALFLRRRDPRRGRLVDVPRSARRHGAAARRTRRSTGWCSPRRARWPGRWSPGGYFGYALSWVGVTDAASSAAQRMVQLGAGRCRGCADRRRIAAPRTSVSGQPRRRRDLRCAHGQYFPPGTSQPPSSAQRPRHRRRRPAEPGHRRRRARAADPVPGLAQRLLRARARLRLGRRAHRLHRARAEPPRQRDRPGRAGAGLPVPVLRARRRARRVHHRDDRPARRPRPRGPELEGTIVERRRSAPWRPRPACSARPAAPTRPTQLVAELQERVQELEIRRPRRPTSSPAGRASRPSST